MASSKDELKSGGRDDRLSGPSHRLDIGISAAAGAATRALPHGIVE